ncbi:Ger(x)C family spore germination protein [Paenibacillus sp. GCM10012307]|uniref:Ger(X)C family spore germination protein n=1 Tax=Paenibacillus roseus TaxID=2798579 RepID=A0A934J4R3_9BACL|nr:Ger(x)C family spore germination protein [Paenibacillus roseus]MBJ6360313.1 Ger(x)C family spore germination protein [Paenibacillus roseus]
MFFRFLKTCLLLSVLPLLGGCWSQINFDQLTVVSSLGLDLNPDKRLEVTIQLVNPTLPISAGGGNQQRRSIATYSAVGATVEDALETIRQQAKKSLFFPQTRVVMIGERLARKGLDGVMDYFWRNQYQNFNSFVLISKEPVRQALGKSQELQAVPADEWKAYLESKYYKSLSGAIELYQFLPRLNQSGYAAAVPGLRSAESYGANQRIMAIEELAVFRHERLVGWMNSDETQMVSWLSGMAKSGSFKVKIDEGTIISFQMNPVAVRLTPVFDGERITLKVKMVAEAGIVTSTAELNLADPDFNRKLVRSLTDHLQRQTEHTVYKLFRTYRTDSIGFGETIHRKAPSKWKKLKKDWEERLKTIKVEPEIKVVMTKSGLLIEGLITKDDEEKK